MRDGCDAILKSKRTGKRRRCRKTPTRPIGTRRIPRSRAEFLRYGGQPKYFCEEHTKMLLPHEVSIINGKPRTGKRGDL